MLDSYWHTFVSSFWHTFGADFHRNFYKSGGESGDSFKLENLDSAHIEICRIGSFHEKWGVVPMEELERIMTNGTTKIPEIEVIPTGVVSNKDIPTEVGVRFDMTENVSSDHFIAAIDKLYSMEYDANKVSNIECRGEVDKKWSRETFNRQCMELAIQYNTIRPQYNSKIF